MFSLGIWTFSPSLLWLTDLMSSMRLLSYLFMKSLICLPIRMYELYSFLPYFHSR